MQSRNSLHLRLSSTPEKTDNMDSDEPWAPQILTMRSTSPSPEIRPSIALGATLPIDRCLSSPPTLTSSASTRSVSSSSDSGSVSSRRQGYVRPQGTTFSTSAKNRESVMSLGSIAHMQYYFARTGLLDGKGGQFAKSKAQAEKVRPSIGMTPSGNSGSSNAAAPAEDDMLPPTVSTYRTKTITSQPPPDLPSLRARLKRSLTDASSALEQPADHGDLSESPASQNSHEIQGLHVLDVLTLAIRSAKDYYTFHPTPQTLHSIMPERQIRSISHEALETLKRMASRTFRGGLREDERAALLRWTGEVSALVSAEESMDAAQAAHRAQWEWLQGDWTDREREREYRFLSSFIADQQALPTWSAPVDHNPTDFLTAMSTGVLLIQLHNELVKQSSQPFGYVKTFYTDLNKPYRCADNLRYWIKAAKLRWQVALDLDVLDIVYSRGSDTWDKFDNAILAWSAAIRREITFELLQGPRSSVATQPMSDIDAWSQDMSTN